MRGVLQADRGGLATRAHPSSFSNNRWQFIYYDGLCKPAGKLTQYINLNLKHAAILVTYMKYLHTIKKNVKCVGSLPVNHAFSQYSSRVSMTQGSDKLSFCLSFVWEIKRKPIN